MTTITKDVCITRLADGSAERRWVLPVPGSVYRAGGKVPKVAMIATHYNVDFSEHYLAEYMASRGIGFWVGILATEASSTSSCSSTH